MRQPPPAGPEPVATVQVSPDQLDLEKGESEQLNVTLLDAGGAALTGRSITYNSNATGVATVNNDGLVTAVGKGEAQITVSSEGVSDDALVTVSLADFAPASDMSLSGLQEFATLSIPEGVKVSATDDLELLVEGLAEIAGALESDCKAIKVSSEDFTLTGTIDTGCSDETAAGAPLTIDANGFVELVGAITYGGKVDISNDPTLTDADFEIPMGAAASSLAGQAAFGAVVNVDATPSPATAPDGADGRDWVLSFRGDVEIGPLSNIRGQNGGDGGDAGRIRVRVTGNLRVGGTITAGKGGDGAEGEDVAAAGQNANATGGAGGVSGTVLITSGGGALDVGEVTVDLNQGGNGGAANATGGDGANPGQAGGAASARGGDGGRTPDLQFRGISLTGMFAVARGDGGPGGGATAIGGGGAAGKPGGAGGSMDAFGGDGGDALARNLDGTPLGMGGMGGAASFSGGIGGPGLHMCNDPVGAGGNGGGGGSAFGNVGRGGTGAAEGENGDLAIGQHTGGGGDGGDGNGPGAGGVGGTDNTERMDPAPKEIADEGHNFHDGNPGNPCPDPGDVAIVVPDLSEAIHFVGETPCPQTLGTITVTNSTASAGTYIVASNDGLISFQVPPGGVQIGMLAGSIGPGETIVVNVLFNCASATDVDAILTGSVSAGDKSAMGTGSAKVTISGGGG